MNYYTRLDENTIICDICPRHCRLKTGQSGFCKIRVNTGKSVEIPSFGHIAAINIDPVEKKPLYHFYPSSRVFSIGTYGCNMGCRFCQNYSLTKINSNPFDLKKYMPVQIVEAALMHGCKSIAFTYNDPIVFMEYAISVAKIARKNNLKTIAVSSGYMEEKPRIELYNYIDAANIDLKGFDEKFYSKNCLAHLKPVLETIKYIRYQTNCHLELTTLLIEGENDSDSMLHKQCEWIAQNLGENIPLHFSAFHPAYKFNNKNRTSYQTLKKACKIAKSYGLNYIYTGNVHSIETSTTYCKNCTKPLIVRDGFRVLEYNLDTSGNCNHCKTKCDGVFT